MVAKRRVYRDLADVVPGFMTKYNKKELESIWSPSINALAKNRLMDEAFFFTKKPAKAGNSDGTAKNAIPIRVHRAENLSFFQLL